PSPPSPGPAGPWPGPAPPSGSRRLPSSPPPRCATRWCGPPLRARRRAAGATRRPARPRRLRAARRSATIRSSPSRSCTFLLLRVARGRELPDQARVRDDHVHAHVPGRLGYLGQHLEIVREADADGARVARECAIVPAAPATEPDTAHVEGDARHEEND